MHEQLAQSSPEKESIRRGSFVSKTTAKLMILIGSMMGAAMVLSERDPRRTDKKPTKPDLKPPAATVPEHPGGENGEEVQTFKWHIEQQGEDRHLMLKVHERVYRADPPLPASAEILKVDDHRNGLRIELLYHTNVIVNIAQAFEQMLLQRLARAETESVETSVPYTLEIPPEPELSGWRGMLRNVLQPETQRAAKQALAEAMIPNPREVTFTEVKTKTPPKTTLASIRRAHP
ncbi:hypothetical protein HYZ99_05105 [Candidatus Peregrinibacteria bacterium]|nr:hypothetical protein [Candidatus Peregrinibacteria bacterium]